MPKIHVLLKKEELDQQRLEGKVVVVLDVLFATSTIVTALAHGAAEVIPTLDETAAREEARRFAPGSFVIAGEFMAENIPGFAPPTPLALLRHELAGKTLIYSTTNGTVALSKSKDADHVYAAALLNGEAVVKRVVLDHPEDTVLIVCSGSADNFNLEDFYGAGYLVDLLRAQLGDKAEYSDAALAARHLYLGTDTTACLLEARVGRMMVAKGLTEEVRFAARHSEFDVVPTLVEGRLRAM